MGRRIALVEGLGPVTSVLVTGASGFVGSRLVRLCRARAMTTFAAVRPGSNLERLDGVAGHVVVHADLNDSRSMRALALETRPDVAIHAAWHIAPDVHESPENLLSAAGSLALLRALDEAGCKRAVFVGTHLEHATSELDIAGDAKVAPRSVYAAAKNATREVGDAFARSRGSTFAWARLFNLYGPGQASWQLVPTIVQSLLDRAPCDLGDGEDVRGYMHVDDAARALLAIAESDRSGAFSVGSSEALTVRALATRIADRLGGHEFLRFGTRPRSPHDGARVVADTARLRDELSFVPDTSLDSGLDATIAWWKAHRATNPNPSASR